MPINSETKLKVFVSSRQTPSVNWARDEARAAINEIPIMRPWLFEDTLASSEDPESSFNRHVAEADIVILLIGADTSESVIQESLTCIKAGGRLLAFLLPVSDRDAKTEEWISRIQSSAKWCKLSQHDSVRECIKESLWEEVVRAVRGVNFPNRNRQLLGLADQSSAMCEFNWRSLGVSDEIARGLAADESVGSVEVEMRPGEIAFVVGEQGSGKTLALHRMNQEFLRIAAADSMAPVPVFVRARSRAQSLEDHVASVTSGFVVRGEEIVLLLVDGLNEIEPQRAKDLLGEVHGFVSTNPSSLAVIATEPTPLIEGLGLITQIPQMSEEQALSMLSRVSGREVDWREVWSWPSSMRDAVRLPMFNVMTGSELAHAGYLQVSRPVELIHRIMRRMVEDSSNVELALGELLLRLAIEAVQEGGSVEVSEVSGNLEDQMRILESRLTVRDGTKVDFALPIFRDWYAARALIERRVLLSEINPIVEKWIVPTAIAISSGDHERSKSLMGASAQVNAGFAGRVMNAAGYQYLSERDDGLPTGGALTLGEELRGAFNDWSNSLGDLMSEISPRARNGDLAPLGIRRGDWMGWGMITTAWYMGSNQLDPVIELPANIHSMSPSPEWKFLQSKRIDSICTWPWIFAKNVLAESLTELVNSRFLGLDSNDGIHELTHEFCCHLIDGPWQVPSRVAVKEALEAISGSSQIRLARFGANRNYGPGQIEMVETYLRQEFAGDNRAIIASKWPEPDREYPKGKQSWGWWECYSHERLVSRMAAIYGAAIRIYEEIVCRRLPCFSDWLPFNQTLPVSFEGRLIFPEGETNFESRPYLHWWIRPLEKSDDSRVSFEVGSTDPAHESESQELLESARNAASAHGSGFWTGVSSLESEQFVPAVELAHKWLSGDLDSLGWNETGFGAMLE